MQQASGLVIREPSVSVVQVSDGHATTLALALLSVNRYDGRMQATRTITAPMLTIRLTEEERTLILDASEKVGARFPAIWARTVLLQAAARALGQRAK